MGKAQAAVRARLGVTSYKTLARRFEVANQGKNLPRPLQPHTRKQPVSSLFCLCFVSSCRAPVYPRIRYSDSGRATLLAPFESSPLATALAKLRNSAVLQDSPAVFSRPAADASRTAVCSPPRIVSNAFLPYPRHLLRINPCPRTVPSPTI
ncbi:hypothetical protein C8J57DRAFT_1713605 [Mycena rebaudengoi]|nr:hypothetical protein C8J57DRAFT_1713605 [Mycena rebaudengoi]